MQQFSFNHVICSHIDLVKKKGGGRNCSKTKDNSPSYSTNIAAMTTHENDEKIGVKEFHGNVHEDKILYHHIGIVI